MEQYLNLAMVVISIALMAAVVLQSRGAGLGGLTGGSFGGSGYHVRRGVERLLFHITIGLSVAFFVLALAIVIVSG